MCANLVAARGVLWVIRLGFNSAAIRVKPEVMARLVVRESHNLIPAFGNALMMLILL